MPEKVINKRKKYTRQEVIDLLVKFKRDIDTLHGSRDNPEGWLNHTETFVYGCGRSDCGMSGPGCRRDDCSYT